jgi:hypothetical protein
MTTNQFKIGDRVTLARPDDLDVLNGLKAGMTGTVRRIKSFGRFDIALVQFDGYMRGTRGGFDGDGTPSHRNIVTNQLEPLAEANAV